MNQMLHVQSFAQLVNTPFSGTINAMCWDREVFGDFEEVAKKLPQTADITVVTVEDLKQLDLSEAGQLARKMIVDDLALLTAYGADPVINLICSYEEDDFFLSTDVYSFHVDRSPIPCDTFLCTYYGPSSEIIPNKDAIQKVKIPAVRKLLEALYDGPSSGFEDFMSEYSFDLHYEVKSDAIPISLSQGQIWRLAIEHPEREVPPCIHRAPKEQGALRLMMIC